MGKQQTPLWRVFIRMSKGDPRLLCDLKKIAATAQSIDPDCPLGPNGVLESIDGYNLPISDLKRMFRLCGHDPLLINAIDYAIYSKKLNVTDLKKAVKNGFRNFNTRKVLADVKAAHRRFGKYYTPRTTKI